MTREEAIETLKTDGCYECPVGCSNPYHCNNASCNLREATHMAICSLEAWDSVINELYKLQEPGNPSLVVTMRIDHLINLIKKYLKEAEDEQIL